MDAIGIKQSQLFAPHRGRFSKRTVRIKENSGGSITS